MIVAAAALLVSCHDREYEHIEADRVVGSWGVTNRTRTFGQDDSLYYLINPVGNVFDTIYFNGDYTDSYYQSDSTRVMLRYTTDDSIVFSLARHYFVETNPNTLVMEVSKKTDGHKKKSRHEADSLKCRLTLVKDTHNDNIFRSGPDRDFTRMLKDGGILHFTATNGAAPSAPPGSQNYVFTLDADGFEKALSMADSLNRKPRKHTDENKKLNSNKK